MRILKYCVLYLLFITFSSKATVITVSPDSSSIQAAIDASQTGDTVLVQPGIYQEILNFNGKNIVVGSLFLTTNSKNYIYETIIEGNNNGRVVTFENGEDSCTVLAGFTITNGLSYSGAGIYIENSSPYLENLIVSKNRASGWGGGICCVNDASPLLNNIILYENSARFNGGGISLEESQPILKNVTVINNKSEERGGGISLHNSQPIFLPNSRSNIYLNHAKYGSDFYSEGVNNITVYLDTFTVSSPTEYQAIPIDNYIFNIKHPKVKQINADLYVSSDGDDNNDGLEENKSLKTLFMALNKINADSLIPRKIFLNSGFYSPKTNGEIFPVKCKSNVYVQGSGAINTIIDADSSSGVIFCYHVKNVIIDNLTIQNGSNYEGGGLSSRNSEITLTNISILNNKGVSGGGIFCQNGSKLIFDHGTISGNSSLAGTGGGIHAANSVIKLSNVNITDNLCGQGGGLHFINDQSSELFDVNVLKNYADHSGGGIYCYHSSPNFYRVNINYNSGKYTCGIVCTENSNPTFINSTLYHNIAEDTSYGVIKLHDNSNPLFLNSIIWNNTPKEVIFSEYARRNKITLAFTNIEGGQSAFSLVNNDTLNWLEGNIFQDPIFLELNTGLAELTENSPCIDAGISFFAWDGDTLLNLPDSSFNGIAPDMGAIESDFTTILSYSNNYPINYKVYQNYPNPFNPETVISYQLPVNVEVELTVYNILGQKVKTLLRQKQNAGNHKIKFDASELASGVYIYKLQTEDFICSKKMLLLR